MGESDPGKSPSFPGCGGKALRHKPAEDLRAGQLPARWLFGGTADELLECTWARHRNCDPQIGRAKVGADQRAGGLADRGVNTPRQRLGQDTGTQSAAVLSSGRNKVA